MCLSDKEFAYMWKGLCSSPMAKGWRRRLNCQVHFVLYSSFLFLLRMQTKSQEVAR